MGAQSGRSESDAYLIAAARAAASWARARRATWTDRPLPVVPVEVEPFETAEEPLDVEPDAAPLDLESEQPFDAEPERPIALPDEPKPGPSMAASFLAGARTWGPSVGRWAAIVAVAAGVAAAAWKGAPYVRRQLAAITIRTAPVPSPRDAGGTSAPPSSAAELRVKSTPAGARVLVDGKERGVTPLTLTDVAAGTHEITLASSAGSVRRRVKVAAREVADIDESIFPGWVAVLAPFDIEVSENGQPLRPDDRDQILLPPGVHELRLRNAPLNYTAVQRVEVTPGTTIPLRVTPPSSSLTVTAAAPSEVWLDGTHVGDTPLNAIAVPLGTHEIVVKRAGAADRRFTLTMGTSPVTLNADAAAR